MRPVLAAGLLALPLLFVPAGAAALPAATQAATSPASPQVDGKRPAIPYKQGDPADTLAIKAIGGLLVAALVSIGLALAIRRFAPGLAGRGKPGGGLRIQQRVRLSATAQLIVVSTDDEELLLAESGGGVQLLRSRPSPGPIGATEPEHG